MDTNEIDSVKDAPTVGDAPATPPMAALAVIVPRDDAAIIEAMVRADASPTQIAADFGLSFHDLLAWSDRPDLNDAVRRMCALNLHQMRVMLTRFASAAAVSLLRLASKEQIDPPAEVARKSCVDLLDLMRVAITASNPIALIAETRPAAAGEINKAGGSPAPPSMPASPAGPRGPSEEAILRALELIDQQHENEPQQQWRHAPQGGTAVGEPRMNTDKHGCDLEIGGPNEDRQ